MTWKPSKKEKRSYLIFWGVSIPRVFTGYPRAGVARPRRTRHRGRHDAAGMRYRRGFVK